MPYQAAMEKGKNGLTYADAGVDIDAGNALVKRIAPLAAATARPGADAALGGFGGLFDLKAAGFNDPVLIAATDGVGTKLKLAIDSGIFHTIGQDLVAMCVNDLLAQGAEPLFFLDYYACARLEIDQAAEVVTGIAGACRESGCALIGGETAEMPGLYAPGDFDLAGFAVGAAERGRLLPHGDIEAGDVLLGLASDGPHANGFSLVRRVLEVAGLGLDAPAPFAAGKSVAEALLEPTRLYVQPLLPLIREGKIKALAHITGGGLTENVPRVLPGGVDARIDMDAWELPAVFRWLERAGGIAEDEMRRTFNCGIGLAIAVGEGEADEVSARLAQAGETVYPIGGIVPGKEEKPAVRYGASA